MSEVQEKFDAWWDSADADETRLLVMSIADETWRQITHDAAFQAYLAGREQGAWDFG